MAFAAGCPDQGLSTYNAEPVAKITSPGDGGAASEGELIPLRGQVSDSNDGPSELVAAWFADTIMLCPAAPPDEDGLISCEWTADLSGAVLRLEVVDPRGAAGTASIQLEVAPNAAPNATITLPTGLDAYYAGSLIEFDGTASDVEDPAAALVATWDSALDGSLEIAPTLAADGHSRGAVALSEGEHFLTFQVADSFGRSTADTRIVLVGPPRQEPSVVITAPADKSVVNVGETLTFEATLADGQDPADALLVSWSSDLDGTFDETAADSLGRVAVSTSALSRGTHVVTLSATDLDGNRTTAAVDIRVNGLPSAPIVELGPIGARTTDPLSAMIPVGSIDPDGDPVTYTFSWLQDGIPSAASVTESLTDAATSKGEVWTVVVTPSDGITTGEPGTAALRIENSVPVVSSVSITPTSATTDDVLTASATTTDDDGDVVQVVYAWSVDENVSGNGETLDGRTSFSKGSTVRVEARPHDGTDVGDWLSSGSIVVQNSAPSAAIVGIGPADPREGVDDLTCAVSSADADGDELSWTVVWTVDGVAFEDATTSVESGDTVPAEWTAVGEIWTCTATPFDGEVSGIAGTGATTIGACPTAQAKACPLATCAEVLLSGVGSADGRYWIDPDAMGAFEAYCDQSHDGGGWTLVAVSSDDATDTWTYTNRRYWDLDATPFGNISALNYDFKSEALSRLAATDVLVVHTPSSTWAAYGEIGDGSQSLASIIADYGDESCWRGGDGFELTAGSLVASGGLCDTDLYLNAADHDGGGGSCSCADCTDHAYGPSWNVDNGGGCPFDDPGAMGSLGPSSDQSGEGSALGFGAALGLNSGTVGAGENFIWLFVR